MSASRLDELTTVVLAPNPSPLTLEGTNTYLLGVPGCGEAIVVDPGPDLLEHRRAVDDALAERHAAVAAVVVTHHHADHAGGAIWAEEWGAQLSAFTPALIRPAQAAPLRDGDVVRSAGIVLEAIHTPGHCSDHLCLRVTETGVVLTGDHVLGRGTSLVAHPDGDLSDYLSSLHRLAGLDATALYPGHGPVIEDADAVVAGYLAHRAHRERQVLEALAAGDRTPAGVVARVYADVDPRLHPAAERSVRAHLDKLVADGLVLTAEGEVFLRQPRGR